MNVTPALVDRALRQTYCAGLTYAVVPLPWLREWAEWIVDGNMQRFWGDVYPCFWGPGDPEPDDDGNVWLCLLDNVEGHEHGWAHVRENNSVIAGRISTP